jgi:formylglycine-generating enzyme required for sulfatase activity/tRNA A-37 threonylcarbamoyl transferase component Bud32
MVEAPKRTDDSDPVTLNSLRTGHPAQYVPPAEAPGQVIADRYEILEQIGAGGMGVTYRALDRKLGREIAIKRLRAPSAAGRKGIERFLREARVIASLNHRNIVTVHEHDADEHGPFIVMQYVLGGDLSQRIERDGKIELTEALKIIKAVGQALAYAHRKSVFHRDVKPSNILLTEEGVPQLVDFGLAQIGGESDLSVTGYAMGTATYMAPEQRRDAKHVDHRCDIYALAKTLYHMLTGDIPDAIDLDMISVSVRPAVKRALKPNPEDRPFSVEEFLRDLDSPESMAGSVVPGGGVAAPGTCPNCGAGNPEEARFCEGCGSGLFEKCPKCDSEFRAGTRHCRSCGTHAARYNEAKEALAQARDHIEARQFSQAVRCAKRGLSAGYFREELAAVRKEAGEAVSRLRTLRAESESLIAEEKYEQAEESLRAALELTPSDEELGEMLSGLPDMIRDRDIRLICEKAAELIAQESYEGAIRVLERAWRLAPEREDVQTLRAEAIRGERGRKTNFLLAEARALVEAERFEDAGPKLRKALDVDPAREDITALLADLPERIVRRDISAALVQLRQLLEENNFPAAKAAFERAWKLDEHNEEVILLRRQAEGLADSHAEGLRQAGEFREEHEFDRALSLLKELGETFPWDIDIARRAEECERLIQKIADLRSSGCDMERRHKLSRALSAWQELLALVPSDSEAKERTALLTERVRVVRRRKIVAIGVSIAAILLLSLLAGWIRSGLHRAASAKTDVKDAFATKRYAEVPALARRYAEVCDLPLIPISEEDREEMKSLADRSAKFVSQMRQHQDEGDKLFSREEYVKAREAYASVVAIQSDFGHAQTRMNEADASAARVRAVEAKRNAQGKDAEFASSNWSAAEAFFAKATEAFSQGQFTTAKDTWTEAAASYSKAEQAAIAAIAAVKSRDAAMAAKQFAENVKIRASSAHAESAASELWREASGAFDGAVLAFGKKNYPQAETLWVIATAGYGKAEKAAIAAIPAIAAGKLLDAAMAARQTAVTANAVTFASSPWSAAEALLAKAAKAFGQGKFTSAKDTWTAAAIGYGKAARAAVAVGKLRDTAITARQSAESAKTKASSANAKSDAGELWRQASATLDAASLAFGEKNYQQAEKLWAIAVGQYGKATEYSLGVRSVRAARGKYERALAGCDAARIRRYLAEQWRVITAGVQDAETADKAGQFAKAVSSYEKVTGLLPAAERIAAKSEKDANAAALLSHAKKILDSMPSNVAKVTTSQKGELRRAWKAVAAVLVHKPSDREALALKKRIAVFFILSKTLALDLGKGVTLKLVLIPAGKFQIGSPKTETNRNNDEGPQREVTISKPFYMGITEVTQSQWKAVMGTDRSGDKSGSNNAVSHISWSNANKFCKVLSKKTGRKVMLPTEAQWEYACRAGSKTAYSFGDDSSKLGNYAWYTKNAWDIGKQYPHAVGRKKPNAWGLYDMHGNVLEWCSHFYDANSYSKAKNVDPENTTKGWRRVQRGGSFLLGLGACRSADRSWNSGATAIDFGFRVLVSAGGVD